MYKPKYNNHKINIISCNAFGLFCSSKTAKKNALNEAIKKMIFINTKLGFFQGLPSVRGKHKLFVQELTSAW